MKEIYGWDKRKAQINLAKHKVSFEEGETIFDDPFLITYHDELHSEKEERLISIGISKNQRILLVVHVEKQETADFILVRIISCRKATPSERKLYEESK
ncbi:MAG: BrnT family toxin [Anaerolineales bacterium]|nr:BrnT family toxin [Anaerolineales bacterium]